MWVNFTDVLWMNTWPTHKKLALGNDKALYYEVFYKLFNTIITYVYDVNHIDNMCMCIDKSIKFFSYQVQIVKAFSVIKSFFFSFY